MQSRTTLNTDQDQDKEIDKRIEMLVRTFQFVKSLPTHGLNTYKESAEKHKERNQSTLFHLWLISHSLLLCQSVKVCAKAITSKAPLHRDLLLELGLAAATGFTLFKMQRHKAEVEEPTVSASQSNTR